MSASRQAKVGNKGFRVMKSICRTDDQLYSSIMRSTDDKRSESFAQRSSMHMPTAVRPNARRHSRALEAT